MSATRLSRLGERGDRNPGHDGVRPAQGERACDRQEGRDGRPCARRTPWRGAQPCEGVQGEPGNDGEGGGRLCEVVQVPGHEEKQAHLEQQEDRAQPVQGLAGGRMSVPPGEQGSCADQEPAKTAKGDGHGCGGLDLVCVAEELHRVPAQYRMLSSCSRTGVLPEYRH